MDRVLDITPAKKILGFNPMPFREAVVLVMKEENWL